MQSKSKHHRNCYQKITSVGNREIPGNVFDFTLTMNGMLKKIYIKKT